MPEQKGQSHAVAKSMSVVKRTHAELRSALIDHYGDVYTANRFWRQLPHPRSYHGAFVEKLALPARIVGLIDAYFDAMEYRDAVFAKEQARDV